MKSLLDLVARCRLWEEHGHGPLCSGNPWPQSDSAKLYPPVEIKRYLKLLEISLGAHLPNLQPPDKSRKEEQHWHQSGVNYKVQSSRSFLIHDATAGSQL